MNAEIREGNSSMGKVLFNWDGNYLRQGNSSMGTVVLNFDGEYIRQGSSSMGTTLFNWDGKNIKKGSSSMGEYYCLILTKKILGKVVQVWEMFYSIMMVNI